MSVYANLCLINILNMKPGISVEFSLYTTFGDLILNRADFRHGPVCFLVAQLPSAVADTMNTTL